MVHSERLGLDDWVWWLDVDFFAEILGKNLNWRVFLWVFEPEGWLTIA